MRNYRVVEMYHNLINNKEISVKELSEKNAVSIRTIQRDINDLKNFLFENNSEYKIVYSRKTRTYKLNKISDSKLTKGQILAIAKILLDSRAFLKTEIYNILDNFINFCSSDMNKDTILELVNNERFHYLELEHHKKNPRNIDFTNNILVLGEAIKNKKKIKIIYDREIKFVERLIAPVGIIFSEYYFYLLANIDDDGIKERFNNKDDPYPTIYRVDRIKNIEVTNQKIKTEYKNRFQEGEFRKRIHFMTGGKLKKVKFIYIGNNLEAILDKIPTAKVLKEAVFENGNEYLISAEVFGNGIDRYLRSLGKDIKNIEEH